MIDFGQIPFLAEIAVAVASAVTATITIMLKNKKSQNTISKQLEKNGGSSLVDKVDHILDKLSIISLQLHRMETWKTAWMELTEEPIFVTDTSGNFVWINNSFAHLAGSTSDDLLGLGWTKVIHWQDKEQVIAEWKSCISSLSKFEYTYRIINVYTKEPTTVRAIAKPLKDQAGLLVGYIGMYYTQEKEEAPPQ